MRRREFIAATAATCMYPGVGLAQPFPLRRVGLLHPLAPITKETEQGAAFLRKLADLGHVLGQNLAIEPRGAMGRLDRVPALLQELLEQRVEVLVTNGFPIARAAKASGHPAVVAVGAGDPVVTGLAESFAKPGGTITGISDPATELSTKRLALLKELLPRLGHVAMLWNQDDLGMSLRYRASSQAAAALGIRVQALGVREPDDFEAAFSAMEADPPDAILMVSDSLTNLNRKRVFEFALARRLPAIYELAFYVRDGGLMSYGPTFSELYERAAALVDKILKGAKAGDLPFEQPTQFSLALNLRTARTMNLELPPLLLARADEVIE